MLHASFHESNFARKATLADIVTGLTRVRWTEDSMALFKTRSAGGAPSVAVCARDMGIPNLILPADYAAEAAVVSGVNVYEVRHLAEVVALLTRPEEFQPANVMANGHRAESNAGPSFATCAAKRALEMAAAGAHNV